MQVVTNVYIQSANISSCASTKCRVRKQKSFQGRLFGGTIRQSILLKAALAIAFDGETCLAIAQMSVAESCDSSAIYFQPERSLSLKNT